MTRLTTAIAGTIVVGIASLVGCEIYNEVTEPVHGTVVRKEYQPAYDYVTTQTSCTAYDKNGVCTSSVSIPVWNHVPECYEVIYELKGKKGDACVAPTEYLLYTVGTEYPR